ncbi:MAG: DUF6290 family protein [Candidatus Saccharimonadales bacterium]
MSNEKTTLYLNPQVKKNVQYYAIRDNLSLSQIVNEKLVEYLEDMIDSHEFQKAKRDNTDDYIPIEQAIKELGLSVDEIRSKALEKRAKTTQPDC